MLPPFNERGDLPEGVYAATWAEVAQHLGSAPESRIRAFSKLQHLYELASRTGKLARFFIFGSFVSTKENPRDVDVILIMQGDFKLEEAPRECRTLFFHADAEARYGASIFWIREGMLPEEMMRDFMDTWQTKRDGTKRGLLEIKL